MTIYNTMSKNEVEHIWKRFINEQTEPFQKKVQQGYVKDRNKYLQGGQGKPSKPFVVSPPNTRSKSAPPIGENEEKLIGGAGDYKPDSYFDAEELKKGIEHENEHTSSRALAKEIVKDHLAQNPKYYSDLESKDIEEGWLGDATKFMGFSQKEPEAEYTDYAEMDQGIYVGGAPLLGGKFMESALNNPKFDRIIVMSIEVANIINNNYGSSQSEMPQQIITKYAISDSANPTEDEKEKLKQAAFYIERFLKAFKPSSVLIVCSKGLNRSVAAASLAMKRMGTKPEEAIAKARKVRGKEALTLYGKTHPGFVPIIMGSDILPFRNPKNEPSIREILRTLKKQKEELK